MTHPLLVRTYGLAPYQDKAFDPSLPVGELGVDPHIEEPIFLTIFDPVCPIVLK